MDYFKMGNEHGRFEMAEWRYEKLHGFKRNQQKKLLKNNNGKKSI